MEGAQSSKVAALPHVPAGEGHKGSSLSTWPSRPVSVFVGCSHPRGCEAVSPCGLCLHLLTSDLESLFMCWVFFLSLSYELSLFLKKSMYSGY